MKHGKYYIDSTNMRVFTNHAQFDYNLTKNSKKLENRKQNGKTKMLAKLCKILLISPTIIQNAEQL